MASGIELKWGSDREAYTVRKTDISKRIRHKKNENDGR